MIYNQRHARFLKTILLILAMTTACADNQTQFAEERAAIAPNTVDQAQDAISEIPINSVEEVAPDNSYPMYPSTEVIVDLKINGSDGPVQVRSEGDIILSWNTNNVKDCSSPAIPSTLPESNQMTVKATADMSYELKCYNLSGEPLVDFVVVEFIETKQPTSLSTPTPVVNLTINGQQHAAHVQAEQEVLIEWQTVEVEGCQFSNNETVESNGSILKAFSEATTLTLSCHSLNGDSILIEDSIEIILNPPDEPAPLPIVDLKVQGQDGPTIQADEDSEVTVTWTSSLVDSCSLSPFSSESLEGEEKITVSEVTTLSLVCQADGQSFTDQITISIIPKPIPPTPPTLDFKIEHKGVFTHAGDTLTVEKGQTIKLYWHAKHASSCEISPITLSGTQGVETIVVHTSGPLKVTCTTAIDSISKEITIHVNEPTPPPTVSIKANGLTSGITTASNEAVMIEWKATLANTCVLSWNGQNLPVAISEKKSFILKNKTTFKITCQAGNMKGHNSIVVNVGPAKKPKVRLFVNKLKNYTVIQPTNVTLSYQAQHIDECTVAGKTIKALTGSLSYQVTATEQVAIICTGSFGQAQDSITTNYKEPNPPVISLTANKKSSNQTAVYGSNATLQWQVASAETCHLTPFGTVPMSGKKQINIKKTEIYSLTCTNKTKKTKKNLKITMKNQPAPALTLTLNGQTSNHIQIPYDRRTTLKWSAKNITPGGSCSDPMGGKLTSGSASFIAKKKQTFTFICQNHAGRSTARTTTLHIVDIPMTVVLSGEEIAKTTAADIIIAFDSSGSMDEETKWLGDKLGEMFNTFFITKNMNLRKIHVHLLLRDDENLFDLKLDHKFHSSLTHYHNTKVGSHDAFSVLAKDFILKEISSKVRKDSRKEILIISDDNGNDYGINSFARDLEAKKSQYFNKTRINGFIALDKKDYGNGCKTVTRADKYLEIKSKKPSWAGKMYNLCSSDWKKMITELSKDIVSTTLSRNLTLEQSIDTSKSFSVKKNGKILAANDYTVTSGGQAIVFKKAPGLKDVITVTFIAK